jgi:hypothetical protein
MRSRDGTCLWVRRGIPGGEFATDEEWAYEMAKRSFSALAKRWHLWLRTWSCSVASSAPIWRLALTGDAARADRGHRPGAFATPAALLMQRHRPAARFPVGRSGGCSSVLSGGVGRRSRRFWLCFAWPRGIGPNNALSAVPFRGHRERGRTLRRSLLSLVVGGIAAGFLSGFGAHRTGCRSPARRAVPSAWPCSTFWLPSCSRLGMSQPRAEVVG